MVLLHWCKPATKSCHPKRCLFCVWSVSGGWHLRAREAPHQPPLMTSLCAEHLRAGAGSTLSSGAPEALATLWLRASHQSPRSFEMTQRPRAGREGHLAVIFLLRSLSVYLLLSDFAPFDSNQRHEPFAHSLERRPVAAQRLQQRALLLFLLVSGESAAAPSLRRQAAQQAETVPHHLAAVWQWHFARDRRASPHPRPRPGGKPAERGPTWGTGAGGETPGTRCLLAALFFHTHLVLRASLLIL